MYIPNGNGLVAREGFSIPDGTGYIIRRSDYGCQPVWPGTFADPFNYTSSASAHDTIFNPYYNVLPDFGATYSVSTDSSGTLLSNSKGGLLYPKCSNFPNLGHHYARLLVHHHDNAGGGGDRFNFSGGPAAFIRDFSAPGSPDLRGYSVNVYTDFDGGFNKCFFVDVYTIAGSFRAQYAQIAANWRTTDALLEIQVNPLGTQTDVLVFLDSVQVISFTDTNANYKYDGGLPGINLGSNSNKAVLTNFISGSL